MRAKEKEKVKKLLLQIENYSRSDLQGSICYTFVLHQFSDEILRALELLFGFDEWNLNAVGGTSIRLYLYKKKEEKENGGT